MTTGMTRTPMRRAPLALGVLTVLPLVLAAPGASDTAGEPFTNPCAVARLRLRCPDLVVSTPSQLHVDRTTRPGHALLRATSSINNHGSGPLELRAHRLGRHRWRVYQVIYDARGHAHLAPSLATLVYKFIPGQRYERGNVGDASYWKMRHAAAMQLWAVDAKFNAVRLVRSGPKVDYCLRDLRRTRPSRHSPSFPVYSACNEDPYLRRDVLGTSAGWSDIYPYEYPRQWIDVTGLRGRFAFVIIADPDHRLIESSGRNDVSETFVQLPSGRVLGRRGRVSQPSARGAALAMRPQCRDMFGSPEPFRPVVAMLHVPPLGTPAL